MSPKMIGGKYARNEEPAVLRSEAAGFAWECYAQEGAAVASAKGSRRGEEAELRNRLRLAMEELGRAVNAEGGVIGHIKAAVDVHTLTAYSLTWDTVNETRAEGCDMEIDAAAIVYGVSAERLLEMARDCFAKAFG